MRKWKCQERYRIYLYNIHTHDCFPSLAKHADLLSLREANKIIELSKDKLKGGWEYRKEKIMTVRRNQP